MLTSFCYAEFSALERITWDSYTNAAGNAVAAGARWVLHVLCEGSPGTESIRVPDEMIPALQQYKRGDQIILKLSHGKYGPRVTELVKPQAAKTA